MHKNLLILIVVLIFIVVGGIFYYGNEQGVATLSKSTTLVSTTTEQQNTADTGTTSTTKNTANSVISTTTATTSSTTSTTDTTVTLLAGMTYTDTGFDPKTLEVAIGSVVIFTNNSNHPLWISSTNDSSIDEGSAITKNQTFTHTFTKAGTWTIANHLNPSDTATITVK